jgi:hypothetical protein
VKETEIPSPSRAALGGEENCRSWGEAGWSARSRAGRSIRMVNLLFAPV